MAKDTKVGLYLGINSVGVTVLQGKDIFSLGRFEFSSLEETGSESKNEDVRWEALINKTLREANSDDSDIYVSLADRDFIFRPLEMPIMRKKEVESSLAYEMEKYIPFKMEELVWDYSYVNFPRERKISLSFVGIKENNFQRVKTILSRLELKAVAIEPSCISLARVVKSSKKFAQSKNFVILDFNQAEASITFFQQDLPVFNRYLIVPKKEGVFDLNSFIEIVNFSFQYFKREFKNYELDRFILVGDSNVASLIPPLKEGLQIEVEPVSSYDLVNRKNAQVENAKALGVAGREHLPYKFKPYLRKTEERLAPLKGPRSNVALRIKTLSLLTGIGLTVTIFLSLILGNEIVDKISALKRREERLIMPAALGMLSWPERAEKLRVEEEKFNAIKKVVTTFPHFSPLFERIATEDILPRRLWLSGLNIAGQKGKFKAVITGYIFRNDDYKERLGVDEFISNLKNDKAIKSIFSRVELQFSERERIESFEVTHFSIILEE